MLETFLYRLRDLCAGDNQLDGAGSRKILQERQARHVLAIASELGLLKHVSFSWRDLRDHKTTFVGTEHFVDLSAERKKVVKITIPPAYGLIPKLLLHPIVDLRGENSEQMRPSIEFVNATPLEYLERWQRANELFHDDVRLVAVVEWTEGELSFIITQPQYHGKPAETSEIESYFRQAGWARLIDPTYEHQIFFNHAFGVMAIDAERRNCNITENGLQPFDVMLCHPDDEMEQFLKIYPE